MSFVITISPERLAPLGRPWVAIHCNGHLF